MSFIKGPLPLWFKLAHGAGSVAFGVKDAGFSFFLLLYYSQVLGMDAALVGTVLLAALVIDALVDPILGYLSDRTYSRWGRRLPWLYIAPIPLAIVWVLLWSPPGGEAPPPAELLAIAVAVRLLLSACEVPSVSLVPEITADYDQRTTLFRYRFLSGWMGGLLMAVLAYTVFMPGADGLLHREGYFAFGVFGAVLMVISVLGSALAQHRVIAHLPKRKPSPFSLKQAFAEIIEAFGERSFVIFALGGLAAYVSQGMTISISNYLNLFIWRFDELALTAYPLVLGLSVVLMFFVVGPMHRRWGKPKSAAASALLAALLIVAPFFLLLAGMWPQVGTIWSTAPLYGFIVLGNMFSIIVMVSASSMIAEIVEAFEERTDRRAEGSFYAGNWLVQKCATGLGIFLTGQIIAFSQLPEKALPGHIAAGVIDRMALAYCAGIIILGLFSAYWLGRFPITRESHEERLRALASDEAPRARASRK